MKRKCMLGAIMSLALVIIISFMLIGCTTATTTTTAASETTEAQVVPEETITLKFLDFWGELEDVMLESIAKFQEINPNIEIKRDVCPWDQAETVLKTNIAGGTPYDIATYWPMYMKTFVEQDAALDLTSAIDSDTDWKSGIEGLIELGSVDGKIYAVPFKSIFAVTYYNKTLFDSYGLTEPETIQEFEEVMKTIKDKGEVAPFTNYDGATCWLPRFMMPALADQAGVLDDFIAGKIDASDPKYLDIYKKPYDIILNWYKQGYLYGDKGAAGISRDEVKVAFSQKEVAMFNETTSEFGAIKESADFEVGVFKFPSVVDPSKYYFFGGADGFFVSQKVKNPEAAIAFLKFMDSPEIQKLWLDKKGITPVNTNVEIQDPVVKLFVDWGKYIKPIELYSLTPELSKYMDASVGELITGAKTTTEIANEINDLARQAVKDN
ncbi:MAG: extracellular solute-binding protein [Actinomycetota bacterium]|nr:extracellular solute-binding protein [Actinomycetota bacterium]